MDEAEDPKRPSLVALLFDRGNSKVGGVLLLVFLESLFSTWFWYWVLVGSAFGFSPKHILSYLWINAYVHAPYPTVNYELPE